MPRDSKKAATNAPKRSAAETKTRLAEALATLEERATEKDLANLERFGIAANAPFGVSMANVQAVAKPIGRDRDLAEALWGTGRYEARLLAAFVDDPAQVDAAQMDRWRADFDNWAVCDTLCFKLFDQSPDAWAMIEPWSALPDEFGKRAAFALLASLAGHDKKAPDAKFLACLPLIERAADDGRNFVKKGLSWALRCVGRRNAALRKPATALAKKLEKSASPSARWIGKDALRDFAKVDARKKGNAGSED